MIPIDMESHHMGISLFPQQYLVKLVKPDSLPSAPCLTRGDTIISLRLLALILCSNCSNNPARLLSHIV